MGDSLTHEDLWSKLYSYMNMCNIQAFLYHHLPPPGTLDYQENMIVKRCFNSESNDHAEFLSFVFDLKVREGARAMNDIFYWNYSVETAREIIIENEWGQDLNITQDISAVTFPVHGPGGRNGCFSLIYKDMLGVTSEQQMRVLQWACQNAHQCFCKLHLSNPKNIPSLTKRETEILLWVARGKSNSVIAQILGISHHTVDTYMRRIFFKLGSSDRTSVSLIGIGNGLIEL